MLSSPSWSGDISRGSKLVGTRLYRWSVAVIGFERPAVMASAQVWMFENRVRLASGSCPTRPTTSGPLSLPVTIEGVVFFFLGCFSKTRVRHKMSVEMAAKVTSEMVLAAVSAGARVAVDPDLSSLFLLKATLLVDLATSATNFTRFLPNELLGSISTRNCGPVVSHLYCEMK